MFFFLNAYSFGTLLSYPSGLRDTKISDLVSLEILLQFVTNFRK